MNARSDRYPSLIRMSGEPTEVVINKAVGADSCYGGQVEPRELQVPPVVP